MKIDERPIKTEYYICYYDIEKSINNRLIEEYFTTTNYKKFKIRLIEMLQNENYIDYDIFEIKYYQGYAYIYELFCIKEKTRGIKTLSEIKEWKEYNRIKNKENYVYQPEMDI